ncbi:MAG: GNAT family N-acetyltransferase [Armatimonadetes bacterium]|nr:GNAT family N-acetyltransferase [Armatimonadota bacterium]
MLQLRISNRPERLAELKESWSDLVLASESASPFQTWEWQSSWWNHFGSGKKLHLVELTEGGDLVGLLPLVQSFSPWRTLRMLGTGPSDILRPIIRPGSETACCQKLAEYLQDEAKRRLIDLHQIPASDGLLAGLPSMTQAARLLLDLPSSYDEYLKGLSKSLRQDVLKGQKNASLKLVAVNEGNLSQALDAFFELHAARWRSRGLPGAFVGGRVKRFHQQWLGLATPLGMNRMQLLELDGQIIGVIYVMGLKNRSYFYQAGMNPEHKSLSPGTVLISGAIQKSIEEGHVLFDFLRGDEPYKRRWKPQRVEENKRILLAERSPIALAGKKWNLMGSQIETKVRDRLEGGSLKSAPKSSANP